MKNIKKSLPFLLLLALFGTPLLASADLSSLQNFIADIADIVGVTIVLLLAGVVFVMFIVNIIKMLRASGDAKEMSELKGKLIWNIILLFAFVAVWGIIGMISNFLGIGVGGTGVVPILSGGAQGQQGN